MFLFVLTYVSVYLAIIEKNKSSFLAMLPAFCVYFLVAALQYDVGTDYFSYIGIFENENRHWYYFNRGEYLFFGLNQLLNWFSLPSQSIFFAISLIQASLFFLYLKLVKNKGFIVWLFFVTFFCVTNIYNNQLNGLRQYVVIAGLPLFALLVHDKKLIKSLCLLFTLSLFHNTAWILLVIYPLIYLQTFISKRLFILFVFSALAYLLAGQFIYQLTSTFLPNYIQYLDGELAEPKSFSLFLTKLYYLPLIFYFYLVYRKGSDTTFGRYFHSMVFIFSVTYWFFLLALTLGIATRLYYYFIFFYAFPIYYVLHYNFSKNRLLTFILLLAYIVMPYVAKVTFLAKAEFLYESILWN